MPQYVVISQLFILQKFGKNENVPKNINSQQHKHYQYYRLRDVLLYLCYEVCNIHRHCVVSFCFHPLPIRLFWPLTSPQERFWRKNRVNNEGSACMGVDLNRNFDFRWGRKYRGLCLDRILATNYSIYCYRLCTLYFL